MKGDLSITLTADSLDLFDKFLYDITEGFFPVSN